MFLAGPFKVNSLGDLEGNPKYNLVLKRLKKYKFFDSAGSKLIRNEFRRIYMIKKAQ